MSCFIKLNLNIFIIYYHQIEATGTDPTTQIQLSNRSFMSKFLNKQAVRCLPLHAGRKLDEINAHSSTETIATPKCSIPSAGI